jgi:DNA replication licensing factor MCM6
METDTAPSAEKPNKQSVKLSYDEYKRISNMLVYFIRKKEDEMDAAAVATDSEQIGGVRKNQVIEWYLSEIESQIENEQQLEEQTLLIEKILNRLINYDSVLIKLDKSGLKAMKIADEDPNANKDDEQNPVLVVHPNYVFNE